MGEPASKAQIRKIHVVAGQLGLGKTDLREMVRNLTDQDSVAGMTKAQAIKLIDYLVDLQNNSYRPAAASPQQIWKIKQLASALGWDNPRRLNGFLKKYAKVERLEWLDARRAYQVIEGLKKMAERLGEGKAAAPAGPESKGGVLY